MPQLSRRNCAKLLTRVSNEAHATSADHEDEQFATKLLESRKDAGRREPRRSQRQQQRPTAPLTPPSSTNTTAIQSAKKHANGSHGPSGSIEDVESSDVEQYHQNTREYADPAAADYERGLGIEAGEHDIRDPSRAIEEDYMRDPESESESSNHGTSPATKAQSHMCAGPTRNFTKPSTLTEPAACATHDASEDNDLEPSWLFEPSQSSQGSGIQRKRKREGAPAATTAPTRTFTNVHAPPQASRTYSKRSAIFGRTAELERKRLQTAKARKGKGDVAGDDAPKRKFQSARAYDVQSKHDHDGDVRTSTRRFKTAISLDCDAPLLSDDSSPLSSPPESIDLNLERDADQKTARPRHQDDLTLACAICGESVDVLLKQAFEDEFIPGQAMTYKWQQRFCRYHRRHHASELWDGLGYPTIEWDRLEQRLRKHDAHLQAVLEAKKPSRYRADLQQRIRTDGKTNLKSLCVDSINIDEESTQRRTSVGYYGPRGEKLMSDHILAHLSSDIRAQAARDKLVAASGISGGVSGFVQLVLVPELAELLVQEDMNVNADRAAEILLESAEVGDLLNPELDETIGEVDEGDEG